MHHVRIPQHLLKIRYQKRKIYTTEQKEDIEHLFKCQSFLKELDKIQRNNFFEIDKTAFFEGHIIDILPFEVFVNKSSPDTKHKMVNLIEFSISK